MDIQDKLTRAKELLHSGQLDDALDACQQALNPHTLKESSAVFVLTGDIYAKKNMLNETISSYLNAINLNPSNQDAWIKFADSIKFANFHVYNELIKQTIIKCLDKPGICHQNLAFPGISLLKLSNSFAEVPIILSNKDPLKYILSEIESQSLIFLEDPLFISLLAKTLIPDSVLEQFCTYVRHAFLKTSTIPECYFPFLSALSAQCFANEYVYFVSDEEQQTIEKMANSSNPLSPKERITLLGCYRPLYQLPYAKNITYPELSSLVKEQITEPIEEQELIKQIQTLKSITDAISKKVGSQYEENPYPRWKTIDAKHPKSVQESLQDIFPYRTIQNGFSLNPKILIAGCGTGQHAINSANSYKNCEVLAIDLSKQSLAYAIRKASEFDVKNISFLQADILDLKLLNLETAVQVDKVMQDFDSESFVIVGDHSQLVKAPTITSDSGLKDCVNLSASTAVSRLNQTFDVIECSGVLHHMEDPFKGWQILTDLLNPNGLMAIGLYSELARQDVVAGRAFIKDHHYQATLEDIRKCRQDIFQLPPGNLIYSLSKSMDFYSTSTCRDLMFHVQEHRFTIPQLSEMIHHLGLEFIGFEMKDPVAFKYYREKFPEDPDAISLTNWHQFELEHPQTFIGMYHLWLKKRDS